MFTTSGNYSLLFILTEFALCGALIFFAGKRVAKYGDIIAEKTALGGLWIGTVLVAISTSLPEIFTGVGSVIFVNAPDLSAGNLFGANTYNLFNIALLDFLHKGAPLLGVISVGQLLTAGLSILPLLIAAVGIFLSLKLPVFRVFHISIYSILIFLTYIICVKVIFDFEKSQRILDELEKEAEEILKYKEIPLKKAYLFYGLSAIIIVVGGIWLAHIGDELARSLNLQKNFIGSIFLGLATTLPEITVSVAALRIGAKEIAVANMLGSNLFNISIIFINDLLYLKGPIFGAFSVNHLLTVFIVILMTCVVISGLILKPKSKTKLGLSVYAILLIVIFLTGAYFNFIWGTK